MKFQQESYIPKVTGRFKFTPGTKRFKKLILSKKPNEEKMEYIFYQYYAKINKHLDGITFKNRSNYLKPVKIPIKFDPLTLFLIQDIYYTWTQSFVPMDRFIYMLIKWFIDTYDTQTLKINKEALPIKIIKNDRIRKIKKFNKMFSKYYYNIMKNKFESNKNRHRVF